MTATATTAKASIEEAEGAFGSRQLGLNSSAPTGPSPRQLNRFIILGKTVGWSKAKETLHICCDQDAMFADQWSLMSERFATHFGDDG